MPFAIGYVVLPRRFAALAALGVVVLWSFAPLGADQPAPWQHGFPGDDDWRVVAFPFWAAAALIFVRLGGAARSRRRLARGR